MANRRDNRIDNSLTLVFKTPACLVQLDQVGQLIFFFLVNLNLRLIQQADMLANICRLIKCENTNRDKQLSKPQESRNPIVANLSPYRTYQDAFSSRKTTQNLPFSQGLEKAILRQLTEPFKMLEKLKTSY